MLANIMVMLPKIALAIISIAEVVALFVPGAQGTVKTVVAALVGLGAKDPQIGQ